MILRFQYVSNDGYRYRVAPRDKQTCNKYTYTKKISLLNLYIYAKFKCNIQKDK